ncbi:hypothetical protein JCM8097_008429 [Rhodosporidiobolus ruineniae]
MTLLRAHQDVIVNFFPPALLCIGCAIGGGIYDGIDGRSSNYYEPNADYTSSTVANAFVIFGAALVLFQNIIPISLVITVELVKTIQAFFIYSDIDLYYQELDLPCVPKTWNISDDLGQIEYIFSDKTGTLTQNVMEFQKCAVGGVSYGEGITEAMLGAAKREGRDTSAFDPAQNVEHLDARKKQTCEILRGGFKNRYLQENKVTLISPPMAEELVHRGTEQHERLAAFWRALAICHTVLTERPDETNPGVLDYKAESPDEAALASAARDAGFVFSNSNHEIEIEALGQKERYVPLRTLAFNSARKRMSSLVRCPDGRVLLICKGADSVIYQRLAADHDQAVIETTSKQLEDFANAGLRTLCISSRYLSNNEFSQWSKIYDQACAAIEDREEEIERACEMVEKDLTILGATALEDKLQVGVPEAIEQLHKAGIKLWILTGDKLQTAIEIGFSCKLLTNQMEIMIISAESEEGTRAQIEAALDKVNRSRFDLTPLDTDTNGEKVSGAVKPDGETLRYALEGNLKPMFLELTTQCNAVVCCRVSSSRKALTVKLVKDGKNAMTLAIGDGAIDVAMIQEAHIGVGIAGLEGAQASMSANYAIGQFRFLTKLLLVHGRWCYIRVADMHANFFYKNIVWTLTLFLYQFFCDFGATLLYDYTLVMLFSLVFTSLPVAILGILDQDFSARSSLAIPQLYPRDNFGKEWTPPMIFARCSTDPQTSSTRIAGFGECQVGGKIKVALKVVKKKARHKQHLHGDLSAVFNEIDVLQGLDHPNVVKFYDHFESREKFYLVFQFASRGELPKQIHNRGKYTEGDAAKVILNVLEGVKYLHSKGIVHRDLPPENLLYVHPGSDLLVIADFSIAKHINPGKSWRVWQEVPVKLQGHGMPVDLWSVGVITYTLLCGYIPFRATDTEQLIEGCKVAKLEFHDRYWKKISPDAKAFVSALVQPNLADRPTAEQALKHKWLTDAVAREHEHDSSEEFRENWNPRRRWKQTINSVIASQRFAKGAAARSAANSTASSAATMPESAFSSPFATRTDDAPRPSVSTDDGEAGFHLAEEDGETDDEREGAEGRERMGGPAEREEKRAMKLGVKAHERRIGENGSEAGSADEAEEEGLRREHEGRRREAMGRVSEGMEGLAV